MATAKELRALADLLEVVEDATVEAAAAKAAYREDKTSEELKAEHRRAGSALAAAREALRRSGLAAVNTTPGSATILPASVAVGATPNSLSEG